jgi:hypothetical protein
MAIIAFLALVVVCGFFLYVLVQFRLEETNHKRRNEADVGVPMATSGQIAMPPKTSKEARRIDPTNDQLRDKSVNRREIQC